MVSTAHPIEPEEVMTYLDGEAPTDRAATIAAHLESCPDCAELAAGFRLVSKRLMAWEVEPAPLRPVEGTPRRVITWKAASVVGLAAAAAMVAECITRVSVPCLIALTLSSVWVVAIIGSPRTARTTFLAKASESIRVPSSTNCLSTMVKLFPAEDCTCFSSWGSWGVV